MPSYLPDIFRNTIAESIYQVYNRHRREKVVSSDRRHLAGGFILNLCFDYPVTLTFKPDNPVFQMQLTAFCFHNSSDLLPHLARPVFRIKKTAYQTRFGSFL